jgi:hypothetical protein
VALSSVNDQQPSVALFPVHENCWLLLLLLLQELLRRISTWLKPGGALFVHIFCHKSSPYHFEVCTAAAANTTCCLPVSLATGLRLWTPQACVKNL